MPYVLEAERLHGIPAGLLRAIAQQESGMDEYAVNADGTDYHPSSVTAAVGLVRRLQAEGAIYIDVGCMQIDMHHHPNAFGSLEDAFNPAKNADYGANFLVSLFGKYRDWMTATAYYHSGETREQQIYLDMVARKFFGLPPASSRARAAAVDSPTQPLRKRRTVKLSAITVETYDDGPLVWQRGN